MNPHRTERIITNMIKEVPHSEWGKYLLEIEEVSSGDLFTLVDFASSLSVIASEVAAYIQGRGGYEYKNDNGHDAAMRLAEERRKKVREVLDYSYP